MREFSSPASPRSPALRELVAKWREQGDAEFFSWRSGADDKCRWRSSTLAQCATELAALLDAPGKAATAEPQDYVAILHEAHRIVNASPLYRRFIAHTPLENDIAVWMADYAQKVRAAALPPARAPEGWQPISTVTKEAPIGPRLWSYDEKNDLFGVGRVHPDTNGAYFVQEGGGRATHWRIPEPPLPAAPHGEKE